ncbi:ChuX/HutX family heme-like substrate-binding protein [Pseudoalteromonas shioyasakiensis]|uniref:ChuX/HutX family heme-like substrate-binding protein n=1 Tax=Pseudoalteromonas shioyasakiensis TaxID=1190813 RepID=UPI002551E6F2|nr:ChuX/HutX family heme-like substrate-binding protein [Pseudoalteromonas shioyasakiensis]MDK9683248.1 ChuX/HutX family heme-like substrate-binding protein [Pseudoalteromonas shioyasakiensis]
MNTIKNQILIVKESSPTIPVDTISIDLKVPEGNVVNACLATESIRLDLTDIEKLLRAVKRLGVVTAMVKNEQVTSVIEGLYEKLYVSEQNNHKIGLAINPGGLDLRLFLYKWAYGFIYQSEHEHFIGFYDKYGQPTQTIHLKDKLQSQVLSDFIARFSHVDQTNMVSFEPIPINSETGLAEQVDLQQLEQDWYTLQDVHHFTSLIEKHNIDRKKAYQLISHQWAEQLTLCSIPSIFSSLQTSKLQVMAFVGNEAAVQIATGVINGHTLQGEHCFLTGKNFKLAINLSTIDSLFVVKKPSDKGAIVVSSIEFFNKQNQTVLTLFGRRLESASLDPDWIAFIDSIWPALQKSA